MYQIIPGATVGTAVLGATVAADNVAHPNAVVQAAQATLPFTGAAVGVYLVIAICLLLAGFIMRHIGRAPAGLE